MQRMDVIWAGLVLACLSFLFLYQGRAGRQADAPAVWPGGLQRRAEFTLVMFAHPKCPCTRASLAQLERLLQSHSLLEAQVVFLQPGSSEADFYRGELWEKAGQLPRVTLVRDEGGALCELFATYTSGQALLYDGAGVLRFAGGLTPGRGHEGDSAGLDAVSAFLAAKPDAAAIPPVPVAVYGCPLFAEGEELCRP